MICPVEIANEMSAFAARLQVEQPAGGRHGFLSAVGHGAGHEDSGSDSDSTTQMRAGTHLQCPVRSFAQDGLNIVGKNRCLCGTTQTPNLAQGTMLFLRVAASGDLTVKHFAFCSLIPSFAVG